MANNINSSEITSLNNRVKRLEGSMLYQHATNTDKKITLLNAKIEAKLENINGKIDAMQKNMILSLASQNKTIKIIKYAAILESTRQREITHRNHEVLKKSYGINRCKT